LIYPYRQGVPFRFDLIKPEIKLKGLFDELWFRIKEENARNRR
jgi:hypothetical protein